MLDNSPTLLDTLKRLPAGTATELKNEDDKTLSHMRQSFVNIL